MKLPESDYLKCEHIGSVSRDMEDIEGFSIRHPETSSGVERYLKQDALADECNSIMRTYMVRSKMTDEFVGFFSLKAGLVAINEQKASGNNALFDTIPGVELANFAIDKMALGRLKHRGFGATVFRTLIVPFIKKHAETLGIYDLYICSSIQSAYRDIRKLWL